MDAASSEPQFSSTARPHPKPDAFLRACITLVLVETGSLVLGGVGIFLMVLGLWIAIQRPLIYLPQMRPWAARWLGFPLPDQAKIKPAGFWSITTTILHALLSLLYAGIGLYMAYIGLKMIFENGFLGQNFIYLLFFRK
jgi:hypothetical protein